METIRISIEQVDEGDKLFVTLPVEIVEVRKREDGHVDVYGYVADNDDFIHRVFENVPPGLLVWKIDDGRDTGI